MYLFWWWMVRLVSFPCSSPNLGLAVRLVHSSKPHRTSLTETREEVRKVWIQVFSAAFSINSSSCLKWNVVLVLSKFNFMRSQCLLTACCTAPIPDRWSLGHSFLSPCPQSSAFHSRICQLSLRKENRVFHLLLQLRLQLWNSCFNDQRPMQHREVKVNIQSQHTVAPQSPALAIPGLTATSITTTLRRKVTEREMCFIKCKDRSIGKGLTNSMTLPVQHHTCSHPVCGHYEDTARERPSSVQHHIGLQMF